MNVNARSIVNKSTDFEHILIEQQPDVVVMTETWLHPAILDSEICPPGYNVIRNDRSSRGGGVAIFIDKRIKYSVLQSPPDLETAWCKAYLGSQEFIIGAVYRSPGVGVDAVNKLDDFLRHLRVQHKNVVIAGDFNIAGVMWDEMLPGTRERETATGILDLCFSHGLKQVVREYTRIQGNSKSVLDLIFLSEGVASRPYNVELFPGFSDHLIVSVTMTLTPFRKTPRPVSSYRDFGMADDTAILDELDYHYGPFEELSRDESVSVNDLWLKFKTLVHKCINMYVPLKRKRKRMHNPWVTREAIHLKRKIGRRRLRCRRTPSSALSDDISALSMKLKSVLKESKSKFYNVTMQKFIRESPQKFWRHLAPARKSVSEIKTEQGIINDKREIAVQFNEFFASVFTKDDKQSVEFRSPAQIPRADDDLQLSVEGILALLLDLKTSKSMGPDEIPNSFLKRYAEWTAMYLHLIFKKSILTSTVPSDWKLSKIIPILKSGDAKSVCNYRPIALTSTSCKVLEHIVSKHIRQFLLSNHVLSQYQHGFRKGLSTVTQLVETIHHFCEVSDRKGQTDIIFLDFKKAFDKVNHRKLLIKLISILGDNKIVRWIEAFLNNRRQFVSIEGVSSDECDVNSGVPQGSVLGPLLFLVFVNDLIEDSPVKARLFADDCVIYTEVKSVNDQIMLNEYLSQINEWCVKWQMSINLDKTVCMTITHKRQPLEYVYMLHGKALSRVSEFRYLGLTITSNLSWTPHVSNIIGKANKRLGYIRRSLKLASSETKLTAYKMLIRPLLEYACEVWDPHVKYLVSNLEQVQRRALRFVFSSYRRLDSVSPLYKRANLPLLQVRRKQKRLNLFYNIMNNLVLVNKQQYINESMSRITRNKHARHVEERKFSKDCLRYSFFLQTAREWNKLPAHVVTAETREEFSSLVSEISNSST